MRLWPAADYEAIVDACPLATTTSRNWSLKVTQSTWLEYIANTASFGQWNEIKLLFYCNRSASSSVSPWTNCAKQTRRRDASQVTITSLPKGIKRLPCSVLHRSSAQSAARPCTRTILQLNPARSLAYTPRGLWVIDSSEIFSHFSSLTVCTVYGCHRQWARTFVQLKLFSSCLKLIITYFNIHHIVSRINFLIYFASLTPVVLFTSSHFTYSTER